MAVPFRLSKRALFAGGIGAYFTSLGAGYMYFRGRQEKVSCLGAVGGIDKRPAWLSPHFPRVTRERGDG